MKNLMRKALCLMLVLVCALSLAACGGSKAVGTYELETMTMGEKTMDIKELAKEAGQEMKLTLEIKSNGKFAMKATGMDDSMNEEGTWEEKGGKLVLTVDDEPAEATYKDGVLTLEEETLGMKLVFKKK